jgi:hypothetical protein
VAVYWPFQEETAMAKHRPGTFEYLEAKIRRDAEGNLYSRDFEWICKWYLENAPIYRGKFKKVWPFRKWPQCWGPDCGVDVIAEAHDGKIWAVQAKAFIAGNTVTKAKVDSFLSETSRSEISQRLLIATTDKLSTNAKRVIRAQEKPVSLLLRESILSEKLVWPSKIGGRPLPCKPATPHPYQQAAISDTLKGFRQHRRGRLIMACGTGKTLTALWIHERLKSKSTLILVPSISLVQQTLQNWGRHALKDFDCLIVCSDESVGSDRDDPGMRYVAEMGVDPTTKVDEIRDFLTKRRKRPAIVISTYQSSDRVSAGQKLARRRFDLAICDESHRLVGGISAFTTILDDSQIRCRHRLFMTATPLYFSNKARRRAAAQDLEVFSMDDVGSFGPEFHRLDFHEAIAARPKPLLTDYRVVVIGVTEPNAAKLVAKGSFVRTEDGIQTDARTLASQIGLLKAMRDYDLRRVITFHGTINRANRFVLGSIPSSLPNVLKRLPAEARPTGSLRTNHISSRMPASKRASALEWLKTLPEGTRGVISNCACLREGVDVPEVDGIAFIDPKRSTVDIIQAVGRAIRLSAGKTVGTIVIPVFIKEGQSAEEILDSSPFKPVWDVLKALRAHDQRLADHLDQIRLGIDQAASATPPRLPPNIDVRIPRLLVKDFEKAFCTRVAANTTQRPFDSWIILCRKWCEVTGKPLAEMNSRDVFKTAPLGRWVNQQRSLNRQHRLFPHQVAALSALGMVWVKKLPSDESWGGWLTLCDKWCARHGSLVDVVRATVFHKRKLGRWLEKQRSRWLADSLPQERFQQLNQRGMVWKPHDESFERGLAACDAWLAQGNSLLNCGRGTIIDGFRFAKWIAVQRKLYRLGNLHPDRIAALELRGMVWDALTAKKQEWHEVLKQYVSEYGSLATVSQDAEYKGRPIGRYLNQRRAFFKKGALSKAEINFLNDLGMVWEPLQVERNKILQMLKEWKRTHGSFDDLKSNTVVGGFRLGAAVARWRTRCRSNTLDPWVESELKKLGIAFDVKRGGAERREQAFALLAKWKKQHRTFDNLTATVVIDGVRLGDILQRWRFQWRRGLLSRSMVSRLKKLGVDRASRLGRKRLKR